ncbi:MAG TPA: hypothetical protein VKQ06_11550 [Gammaproteobacteria bacterium]|nr:hypothetical protein [Gammaproteobacteria bacterium]
MSALRTGAAMACLLGAAAAGAETHYLIVAGLGGQPDYAERFEQQASSLAAAARASVPADNVRLLSGAAATSEAIESALQELASATAAADSVAVFLLGHGSYDGEQYKFNVPGADLDGARFAELLEQLNAGSVLVVNATSASGAVLEDWAGEGRTVITATRSGAERNATRFGEYWAQALAADGADINKNGIITAREAFDFTERSVADSYDEEGALATEHPQLSGDGAERFAAARLVPRAVATPAQRELTAQLEALEEQIAELRERRDALPEDEYLNQLQTLLVELATTRRALDEQTQTDGESAANQ